MRNIQARASVARRAARAACLGILACFAPLAHAGQHGGAAPHAAPAPHAQSQPHAQAPPSRPQQQPARPGGNGQQPNYRPQPGYGSGAGSPQSYSGARPAYGGTPYAVRPNTQAAGHLPQWMAQHHNLPLDQQEHLLRQEPGFNRLSPGEQQRAVQQLHQLNQMPDAQRQRRLAWAENLERLSPAERMQVNQASHQLSAMPADRQAMVRHAFQDLRGVPIDQRQTILSSARYSATFSPEERNVLSNLLRVETYEAPH